MLTLYGVSFAHANGDKLFSNINLSLKKDVKASLIGNNGVGKSTLLNILAGNLQPTEGSVKGTARIWYMPQIAGQFNSITVAQALGVDQKLRSLQAILNGDVTEHHFAIVNNDWTIEERCMEALAHWKLRRISLDQKLGSLSGGQKTKIFLASLLIHEPEMLLLDEPSNHLDKSARALFHDYISNTLNTVLIVSHDRALLNRVEITYELTPHGCISYGGNYDFYLDQKKIAKEALEHDLKSKEKELRKAKEIERQSMERQQRNDSRGRKKQEKAGMPTIMLNTMRNNAERSTAHMKEIHASKISGLTGKLTDLRNEIPPIDRIKMHLTDSGLHRGKVLINVIGVNMTVQGRPLWRESINLQIRSGERLALSGVNGSGKTTLARLIMGQIQPHAGSIERAPFKSMYIDQDYSLLNNKLSIYAQVQCYNSTAIPEHEVKTRLNRFLFGKDEWDKSCESLSGGERMRLSLCAMTISATAPDLIVLDEPTNNLDLQNIEILTSAIGEYRGTLIVISHDEHFLSEIGIEREFEVPFVE